jgi:hypothetical protein
MKSCLLMLTLLLFLATTLFAGDPTYVGWVSDSGCARARASAGKFTATNPDCARRCIKEGKKIVLISQERKTVFAIDNPEVLRSQVGNKVRITASSKGAQLLHVDALTFLEEANPECERPPLKQ